MKQKFLCGTAALAVALGISCKKHKDPVETPIEPIPQSVTYPNYSQLKVGNYWIYERFMVQQDNESRDMHESDSCYIDKDTLIRGNTYFKMHKRDLVFGPVVLFVRDSLHYLINSQGNILFSSQDFSTVFRTRYAITPRYTASGIDSLHTDTLYRVTSKMNDKDLMITVPAGTFKTSSMQSTQLTMDTLYITPYVNNPRYMNSRYSEHVGLVLETDEIFTASNYITEKRLVRYHLN